MVKYFLNANKNQKTDAGGMTYERCATFHAVTCHWNDCHMDDNDIKVEDHDLQWNYVEHFLDQIPDTRNNYAHGSTDLNNHSLKSIHIASEIINQIF